MVIISKPWFRIHTDLKCWIQILIETNAELRIHNDAKQFLYFFNFLKDPDASSAAFPRRGPLWDGGLPAGGIQASPAGQLPWPALQCHGRTVLYCTHLVFGKRLKTLSGFDENFCYCTLLFHWRVRYHTFFKSGLRILILMDPLYFGNPDPHWSQIPELWMLTKEPWRAKHTHSGGGSKWSPGGSLDQWS